MTDISCECQTIDVTFSDDGTEIILNLDEYSGFVDDYNLLRNTPTINGNPIAGDLSSSDFGVITSYSDLSNKPSIDGVELVGALTSEDLGIPHSYSVLSDKPSLDGIFLIGALTSEELGLVKSYNDLTDKPSINSVTVTGNITSEDLGIPSTYSDLPDKPSIDGVTLSGELTSEDIGIPHSYNELNDKPSINGTVLTGDTTVGNLGVVLTDTYANWAAQRNLVSKKDVFYVYTDYQAIDNGNGTVTIYPGLKIGNGYTKLNALPFMNAPDPRLLNHIANNQIHITSEERAKWNKAVNDIAIIQQSLTGGMHTIGETTTELTDGSSVSPIVVDGSSVTPKAGDVVSYGNKEFMYSKRGNWIEFGDSQ